MAGRLVLCFRIMEVVVSHMQGFTQGEDKLKKKLPGMTLDTGEQYGDYLNIYSDFKLVNHTPVLQGEPDYSFDFSDIKPLKVQAGDINGDGQVEIGICVYKTAKFHPVLAKRPFFIV